MGNSFNKFSKKISEWVGTSWAFIIALFCILTWLITGPLFKFSDTWQLVVNTATSVITFLMVFIIQNTQNRNTTILHIKIDELIKSLKRANNNLLDLEELSDSQLRQLEEKFKKFSHHHK